ncbi:MAG TPA: TolC family protein [Thermoanaerobaculia bacterium]|nr:TolC family protein [Thermoanaerobaculia bacterium]
MKRQLAATALFLAGCASVPRDAGVADVQREVARRTNQTVEIRTPTAGDDSRVASILQSGDVDADKAIAIALMNNPSVQVALADIGLARADLLEASTIRNPIFGGEIRFPADPQRPYELTITQSILDVVLLPRRRAAGRAAFEAAKFRVSAEVLAIAADVRADFYDLVGATQHVSMNRTIVESARAAAELAQRQHDAGNITDLDLENQQAMYEQAKLDLARSEEDVLLWREAVIRDLGLRNTATEWKIRADFPAPPASEPTEEETQQLLATRRLDIAAAQHDLEAAQRLLPAARASAIGDIEAGVHRERDAEGGTTTGPSANVPIPIFNRGAAGRARAEARVVQAQQRLAALTAAAGSEVRAARQALLAARARVDYYRGTVLPRRKRIVDLTQLEQNAMVAGVFQLLQAKQNEINARREYIDAQRDYWTARTNLDRALSGIPATTRKGGH